MTAIDRSEKSSRPRIRLVLLGASALIALSVAIRLDPARADSLTNPGGCDGINGIDSVACGALLAGIEPAAGDDGVTDDSHRHGDHDRNPSDHSGSSSGGSSGSGSSSGGSSGSGSS